MALVVGSGTTPGKPAVAYFGMLAPTSAIPYVPLRIQPNQFFEGTFEIARMTRENGTGEDSWFSFATALQTQPVDDDGQSVGFRYRIVTYDGNVIPFSIDGNVLSDLYWGGES